MTSSIPSSDSGNSFDIEYFEKLPHEVQNTIAQNLSEKDAYHLVVAHFKYFKNNDRLPNLMEKYFSYLFNHEIFALIKNKKNFAQKVQGLTKSFFNWVNNQPKNPLDALLKDQNTQKYLKRLNLTHLNHKEIGEIISGLPSSIKKVERLSLQDPKGPNAKGMDGKQFSALLSKCPNLKKLDLVNCADVHFIDDHQIQLDSLEELNIQNSNMTESEFQSLLKKAPNLKKITMSNCPNLQNIDFKDIELNKLKQLHFDHLDISHKSLGSIIEKAPNLEVLNISFCSSIGGLKLTGINETKLKELKIEHSKVTHEDIEAIIEKAPGLKTCFILTENGLQNLDFKQTKCKKMEKISILHEKMIKYKDFSECLRVAPNLKKIVLSNIDSHSMDYADQVILKSLEEVAFELDQYVDLKPETLEHVLDCAPNIKVLDLSKIELGEEFDMKFLKPQTSIEKVLINRKLSNEDINKLIYLAPNAQFFVKKN